MTAVLVEDPCNAIVRVTYSLIFESSLPISRMTNGHKFAGIIDGSRGRCAEIKIR
jgi:hypothetical protein